MKERFEGCANYDPKRHNVECAEQGYNHVFGGWVMKIILLSILLATISITLLAAKPESAFGEYRFEDGGYYLLATPGEPRGEVSGTFYVDDLAVLNEMKKTWVFTESAPYYLCGYTNFVSVCRQGKVLKEIFVNTECGHAVVGEYPFKFEIELLKKFQKTGRQPNRKQKSFSSRQAGIDYIQKKRNDQNLISMELPDWYHFEGRFTINVKIKKSNGNPSSKFLDTEEKTAVDRIRKKFALERFEVFRRESSNKDLSLEIKSSKALFESFDLYPFENTLGEESSWVPYDRFTLVSYWRS